MGARTSNIILLLLCCFSAFAQVGKMTEQEREQQRRFIRQDTLPVVVEALPDEVNTHFSEYCGQLLSDSTFLFTSMRANVDEDIEHLFETSWYCDIYESRLLPNGDYAPAEALPAIINTFKTFNSNFCFNEKRDLLIYSRCTRNMYGELRCTLWQSQRKGQSWSKPKKLPSTINAEGATTLHPHLVDGDDHDVLYFVSDRKQGVGGLDIWYSIHKDGHFQAPVNVGGSINSEGNEVTPFYDRQKGVLYFSSDEHLGIGDYDIFYCPGALNRWGEVSNMGVPFNSGYNDFYFNLNADGKSGYLSSNRPHDGMDDADTCCNDLFQFHWVLPIDTMATPPVDTPDIHEKIASTLPIILYFQNDQPDPRSVSDTTVTEYPDLYAQYMSDNALYVRETGRGLTEAERKTAEQEMRKFLRDSVATGYERLLRLTNYLREALANGDTVEITISGYASPLHNSDYNRHLSSRRIYSLLNYLRKTENGFFIPYLDKKKSGLIIHLDPQGAVQRSFATQETRETVYGVQAAKDRKIIITGGTTNKQ